MKTSCYLSPIHIINRYVPIDLCQLSHLNHVPLAISKSLQLILILKENLQDAYYFTYII